MTWLLLLTTASATRLTAAWADRLGRYPCNPAWKFASKIGSKISLSAPWFSYLSPEARVPRDHPLRPIRDMVNKALAELSGEFQVMYSREGRPSIPPEKLLRALLPFGFFPDSSL